MPIWDAMASGPLTETGKLWDVDAGGVWREIGTVWDVDAGGVWREIWSADMYLMGSPGGNDVQWACSTFSEVPQADGCIEEPLFTLWADFTGWSTLHIDATPPHWGYDTGAGWRNVRTDGYVGYHDSPTPNYTAWLANRVGQGGDNWVAGTRQVYSFDIRQCSGSHVIWAGVDVAGGGVCGTMGIYNIWLE